MKSRTTKRGFLLGASALGLSACAQTTVSTKSLATADHIVVLKGERVMTLYSNDQPIKSYRIHLGFAPQGTKRRYGDGKTPEGDFIIDRRNPNSAYHLSLGINYPSAQDIARAKRRGIDPGGEIFIHGGPRLFADRSKPDWTAGCIAVSDREIEEIWSMVPLGTRISIRA